MRRWGASKGNGARNWEEGARKKKRGGERRRRRKKKKKGERRGKRKKEGGKRERKRGNRRRLRHAVGARARRSDDGTRRDLRARVKMMAVGLGAGTAKSSGKVFDIRELSGKKILKAIFNG